MNPPKNKDMLLFGAEIIDKVKRVFVFGPGNATEYGMDEKDEDLKYKSSWRNAIKRTGRVPSKMVKIQNAPPNAIPIADTDYAFVEVGHSMVFGREGYTMALGSAYTARMGNCLEHALLAIYYCLELQKRTQLFTKIILVSLLGQDHALVRAEYEGGAIYIDPWNSKCYDISDFDKHNIPNTKQLEKLILFADNEVLAAHGQDKAWD